MKVFSLCINSSVLLLPMMRWVKWCSDHSITLFHFKLIKITKFMVSTLLQCLYPTCISVYRAMLLITIIFTSTLVTKVTELGCSVNFVYRSIYTSIRTQDGIDCNAKTIQHVTLTYSIVPKITLMIMKINKKSASTNKANICYFLF